MRRLLLTAAAICSLSVAVQSPASAASFSCMETSHLSSAAQRVCDSRWLSNLDERMDSWYRRALVRAGYFEQTKMVRDAQRDWISQRDSCGSSFWCIRRAYVKRIRDLEKYVEHV